MSSASPARSGERVVHWLLLVVAMVAVGVLVRRGMQRSPTASGRVDPAAIVPPGPQLLVTADVEALADVAGPQLLKAGVGSLLGLKELCGFEPLLAMRRVAFAMPEGSSDFAFIAETTVSSEQVLRCAELTMKKRGGSPVRTRLGRFVSVHDQARPVGEVAIRDDGLFLLSGGKYFRQVLDQAAAATPTDAQARQREQLHRVVRTRLGTNQVNVSSVTLEPHPDPAGLRSFGIAVEVSKRTRIRGYVGCDTEKACTDAVSTAESLRQALAKDPLFAPLTGVRLAQNGAELLAEGEIANEQLAPMLAKLAH